MKTKIKIGRVWIERKIDNDPDTSWLGEYSYNAGEGWYVDRNTETLIDCDREVAAENIPCQWGFGQYKFLVNFQHDGDPKSWAHVTDKGVSETFAKAKTDLETFNVAGRKQAVTREKKIRCLDILHCCQDARRMYHFGRGDWWFLGIIAKCELVVPHPRRKLDFITQTLHSGGLWGIESDSGEKYLNEIGREQLSELADQLEALGLGGRAIERAFDKVETVNK